jgi:hypothetical protein
MSSLDSLELNGTSAKIFPLKFILILLIEKKVMRMTFVSVSSSQALKREGFSKLMQQVFCLPPIKLNS